MSAHDDGLVLESRSEPVFPPEWIHLPEDDGWVHRIDIGGHYMVAFRKLYVMVIGYGPATGMTKALPAHYPVDEIYRHTRSSRPDPTIPADTCFAAIKMLKEAVEART